jgi:hypothetical protein
MLRLLTTIALLYVAWTITAPLARAAFASALMPAPWAIGSARLVANEVGGIAWELITGFVTAPGATQTNLTMATGDSLDRSRGGTGQAGIAGESVGGQSNHRDRPREVATDAR